MPTTGLNWRDQRVLSTRGVRGGSWLLAMAGVACLGGCVFDSTGLRCPQDDAGATACGDGVVDPGEGCDDQNASDGDGCSSDCQVEAGWQCEGEPSVCAFSCGNGTLDPGEECDGAELGGASCTSVPGGFTGGTLACGGGCQYDTTGCILPGCGNGEVGPGEECDDGNTSNEDDCLNNCRLASCGDGYVWAGHEECDDGNALDTDDCLTTCVAASCGDGVVWAGHEECDDGNALDTDDCLTTCVAASCGDGVLWAGHEECDDGNALDTDDCLTTCVAASCGDGFLWAGHEECDDGNTINGDACSASCEAAGCGDGVVWEGHEECDDGNTTGGDGCSASCAVEGYHACEGEPSTCSCVVYVDASATQGNGSGSSWLNATTQLSSGLTQAGSRAAPAGAHCAVWIAGGTYASASTHSLPTRVMVYGGFAGTETSIAQRNVAANATVLDGLGSADSVISGQDVVDSGLDGLTVSGGQGSGYGGGVWLRGQNITLTGCLFESNDAGDDGGAVYITTNSTVTISRCVFRNNSANHNGAGLTVRFGAQVVAHDTLFHSNTAGGQGGAIWVEGSGSSLSLVGCTLAANGSSNDGGLFYNQDGTLTVVNSVLWGNGGNAYQTSGGTTAITYSQVQGGFAGTGNDSANPLFVDPTNHDYQLQSASPCLDSADGDPASALDLRSLPRVDLAVANTGVGTPRYVDRGAYERQSP